jgi:hypothetical protein
MCLIFITMGMQASNGPRYTDASDHNLLEDLSRPGTLYTGVRISLIGVDVLFGNNLTRIIRSSNKLHPNKNSPGRAPHGFASYYKTNSRITRDEVNNYLRGDLSMKLQTLKVNRTPIVSLCVVHIMSQGQGHNLPTQNW